MYLSLLVKGGYAYCLRADGLLWHVCSCAHHKSSLAESISFIDTPRELSFEELPKVFANITKPPPNICVITRAMRANAKQIPCWANVCNDMNYVLKVFLVFLHEFRYLRVIWQSQVLFLQKYSRISWKIVEDALASRYWVSWASPKSIPEKTINWTRMCTFAILSKSLKNQAGFFKNVASL